MALGYFLKLPASLGMRKNLWRGRRRCRGADRSSPALIDGRRMRRIGWGNMALLKHPAGYLLVMAIQIALVAVNAAAKRVSAHGKILLIRILAQAWRSARLRGKVNNSQIGRA